jgi:predicted RNA methylase
MIYKESIVAFLVEIQRSLVEGKRLSKTALNTYELLEALQKSPAALIQELESLNHYFGASVLAEAAALLRSHTEPGSLGWQLTDPLIRNAIPKWHWPMLNDRPRNEAYVEAIKKYVSSDKIVFEIGCGSGLLSIVAAMAGARHVYACESDPIIAACAVENVEAAGLSEKITVINKRAQDIRFGTDILVQSDIVIHEIFSGDLLSEGILETYAEIDKGLFADSATHLPYKIYTKVQGVRSTELDKQHFAHSVMGFDLSALDIYAPSSSRVTPFLDIETAGSSSVVKEYQVSNNEFCEIELGEIYLSELCNEGATGILQWIGFQFPDGTKFENSPGSLSHWKWRYYPLFKKSCEADSILIKMGPSNGGFIVYLEHQRSNNK